MVGVATKPAQTDTFAFSHSRGSNGNVRLAVSGEVDIYVAPQLREAVGSILADPDTTDLVVDFAHVDYVDCTGLSVLIAGRRQAQQQGIRFAVVNPHGQVQRVFSVLSLDHVLGSDPQPCA